MFFRSCILDFVRSWKGCLSSTEFAYNNSYQVSIDIAPYEAFYRRLYRSPLCWENDKDRFTLGLEIIQETIKKVMMIKERLKVVQSCQKSYAGPKGREIEFEVGDYVFLKVTRR